MVQRLLFLAVLVASISASAAQIRVDNPECGSEGFQNAMNVSDQAPIPFAVTDPNNLQPLFSFCNTGEAWDSILIAIHTTQDFGNIHCSTSGAALEGTQPAFEFCQAFDPGNGFLYEEFTNTNPFPEEELAGVSPQYEDGGDDPYPGVGTNHVVIFDLKCLDTSSSECTSPNWNLGDGGAAFANYDLSSNVFPIPSVPEPATL